MLITGDDASLDRHAGADKVVGTRRFGRADTRRVGGSAARGWGGTRPGVWPRSGVLFLYWLSLGVSPRLRSFAFPAGVGTYLPRVSRSAGVRPSRSSCPG